MNRPYPFYNLPQIKSLRQMIECQAEEVPDRIAFQYRKEKQITGKTVHEFWKDVCCLGSWFMLNDIRNKHVALIGPNSYEWLIVFFASIISKNVIVPIDKDLPATEMLTLINHSECDVIFTNNELFQSTVMSSLSCKVVQLYMVEELLRVGDNPPAYYNWLSAEGETDINKPAMIVYTSGTTGQSKGVVLSENNIVTNINQCCKSFNPMGSALSVLPFHHMFGLVPALIMFFHYRSTVFISSGIKYLMKDFQLAKPKATMLVPLFIESFYDRIMKEAEKNKSKQKLLKAMKISLFLYHMGIDIRSRLMKDIRDTFGGNLDYILVGGASLDPEYETAFRSWGINLIPAYGATECAPGIAVNRNNYYRTGSAGLPVDGCKVRIADDGEILIQGDNVFMEYYHDLQSTKEALIDGWYHSGDIGYVDRDGFLFLTGRKKNLIILSNGENISPEQLEMKISAIKGVLEVLVYESEKNIIAEIYPDEQYQNNLSYFEKAVDLLNKALAPSSRIKKVSLRDTKFPRNSSGKILRGRKI